MRLTQLGRLRPGRTARRLRQIAVVLAQGVIIWLRTRRQLKREAQHESTYDSSRCLGITLYHICEKLGPTFIKFGQIISTRRDLLPESLANELARLQDNVSPLPAGEIIAVLEKEYDCALEERFAWFSEVPLGAASLSQVHAARLHGSAEEVVIKVQRPGIRSVIEADIDIISRLVPLLERHIAEFRHINLRSLLEEFYKTLRMELDFTRELYNTIKFHQLFSDNPLVKVPKVYKEHSSTRVLVMERLHGIKIDQLQALDTSGYDRSALAKRLVAVLSKQAFTYGVYNGDVHAGNLMVLPGGVLGLLDFGMVRTIDPETQRLMIDLVLAVITKDAMRLSRLLSSYTEPGHQIDLGALARDIHEILVFYYDLPAEDLHIEVLLETCMELLAEHRLIIPQHLIMFCRATVMTESMVRMLAPEIVFVVELAPYVKEGIKRRFSLGALGTQSTKLLNDGLRLAQALPETLNSLFSHLQSGTLGVDSRNQQLDERLDELNRSARALILALLGGSLFCAAILSAALFQLGATQRWLIGVTLGLALLLCLLACRLLFKRRRNN